MIVEFGDSGQCRLLGTFRTWPPCSAMSVAGGEADMMQEVPRHVSDGA